MPAIGPDFFSQITLPPAVLAQVRAVAQADTTAPADADAPPAAVDGRTGTDATNTTTVAPGTAATPRPKPEGIWALIANPLVPLALVMVFFFVFMGSGNRKKEKARKELLANLARGDRVTTIGGIIGNVVDATGEEVTLKIDENNNTKMKVTRSAVANVNKAGDAA